MELFYNCVNLQITKKKKKKKEMFEIQVTKNITVSEIEMDIKIQNSELKHNKEMIIITWHQRVS